MRIAAFNVESLFRRPSALNQKTWKDGKPILDDFQRFAEIIAKETYSASDKNVLANIIKKYRLQTRKAYQADFFVLNEVRGKLFKVPKGSDEPEIVVSDRADWDGWLELKKDEISSEAIENTARVIKEVNADILAIVEAEDRIALQLFNDQVLKRHGIAYAHNMLIDGNDSRGIDVGIYTNLPLKSIRSNIDVMAGDARIFSRDCAEYEIQINEDTTLLMLINHFKSKGYGKASDSNEKRRKQAAEVARIYEERKKTINFITVAGDFNDTPDSPYLAPLLNQTDLKDVMQHLQYLNGSDKRPGTYQSGSASNKIDYLLLSPALWDKVQNVGVERRGVYAPRTFKSFPEVTSAETAASDHAAVWVDLEM
jgi:endonuclease/exonuclease/phosphatase family metal-dependent hydrolase